MKTFAELNKRLAVLTSGLDGDFWREMLAGVNPPKKFPEEQAFLDMVFRDSKAIGGYIPDVMAVMRKHLPSEISGEEILALGGILGYIQLVSRMLLMILMMPRYNDHDDLINTFNGYRQTLVFIEEYLAQAERQ